MALCPELVEEISLYFGSLMIQIRTREISTLWRDSFRLTKYEESEKDLAWRIAFVHGETLFPLTDKSELYAKACRLHLSDLILSLSFLPYLSIFSNLIRYDFEEMIPLVRSKHKYVSTYETKRVVKDAKKIESVLCVLDPYDNDFLSKRADDLPFFEEILKHFGPDHNYSYLECKLSWKGMADALEILYRVCRLEPDFPNHQHCKDVHLVKYKYMTQSPEVLVDILSSEVLRAKDKIKYVRRYPQYYNNKVLDSIIYQDIPELLFCCPNLVRTRGKEIFVRAALHNKHKIVQRLIGTVWIDERTIAEAYLQACHTCFNEETSLILAQELLKDPELYSVEMLQEIVEEFEDPCPPSNCVFEIPTDMDEFIIVGVILSGDHQYLDSYKSVYCVLLKNLPLNKKKIYHTVCRRGWSPILIGRLINKYASELGDLNEGLQLAIDRQNEEIVKYIQYYVKVD